MTLKKILKPVFSVAVIIIILGLAGLFVFSGDNFDLLRSLFIEEHTNEELREKLADFGVKGYITIIVLSMLQVVISFLPAEPVQVLSGITFGFPVGLLLCTVGVMLGNTLIYILYRTFGNGIRHYFMTNLHLDFEKAARSKQTALVIFILYFLPAIPYGMICFFASSLGMRYPRYITITLLGAIPSVCIGVGLGQMAIASSYIVSIVVFGLILLLLAVVMIKKKAIFDKVNAYLDRPPYSSKTTVRACSRIILPVAYVCSRIVFFLKGVRVRYTSKVEGEIESPSIVLCNHGSFIDFAYAGSLIRKVRPHFIVARLYFYKKLVGNMLRRVGCFPKSMFAADIESAKNCLRVLKTGKVLGMMPEARLSTAGKFEDIQEGTFHFLKKSGVPVYTIKICGDYLASPKWGDGLRRGALVEAELDILFTKEEIEALSVEQIKEGVLKRLDYNEFEWLKEKPEIRYRKKTLAKGLENILPICPRCHSRYTLTSAGKDISCTECGHIGTLDDRYSFIDEKPFENPLAFYEWCEGQIKKEITESGNYSLSSPVTLCMRSSDGKTLLRTAGTGTCTLTREGLTYEGTLDKEDKTIHFAMSDIYRLLFGAGENFEIYVGSEIYYFKPEEKRSCVEWYIASKILKDSSL